MKSTSLWDLCTMPPEPIAELADILNVLDSLHIE
ncbi:hypothetical protein DFAR_360013 [Desulfarculales bacterium]